MIYLLVRQQVYHCLNSPIIDIASGVNTKCIAHSELCRLCANSIRTRFADNIAWYRHHGHLDCNIGIPGKKLRAAVPMAMLQRDRGSGHYSDKVSRTATLQSSSGATSCGLPRMAAIIFCSSSSASSRLSCMSCLTASRPCARRVSP